MGIRFYDEDDWAKAAHKFILRQTQERPVGDRNDDMALFSVHFPAPAQEEKWTTVITHDILYQTT